MALTTIALPSKSENLIYALLPLSIALWFLALWSSAIIAEPELPQELPDLAQSLGLVAVFISLSSVLLYEVSPDEWFVKWLYRRRAGQKSLFQRYGFLLWRYYYRTWDSETANIPFSQGDDKRDYIRTQVGISVQSTVSSPAVERRLWRIRASLYLFFAVIFLFWSAAIAVSVLRTTVDDPELLVQTFGWLPVHAALLFGNFWFVFLGAFWLLQIAVLRRRHRTLVRHIQYASQLEFALKTYGALSVSFGGPPASNVQRELASLDRSLRTGNWTWFSDRMSRVVERMRGDWITQLTQKGFFDLTKPWGELTKLSLLKCETESENARRLSDMDKQKRALGWIAYYFGVLRELRNEDVREKASNLRKLLKKLRMDNYDYLPFPDYSRSDWAFVEQMTHIAVAGLVGAEKPDTMVKLLERMESPKRSRRVIRALMYGLALAGSRENIPDKAEEQAIMTLLRGDIRNELADSKLADRTVVKYLCLDDANRSILETASPDEMKRLYDAGASSEEAWKMILLGFIVKAGGAKLRESSTWAFLKDFEGDADVSVEIQQRLGSTSSD